MERNLELVDMKRSASNMAWQAPAPNATLNSAYEAHCFLLLQPGKMASYVSNISLPSPATTFTVNLPQVHVVEQLEGEAALRPG